MAIDLAALKAEIDTDPLTRGYSGMSNRAVADDMNTVYRSRNLSSMSGDEIFNAADPGELNALAAADKDLFMSFCGRERIDPFAANNTQFIINMFGGGSTTVSNLQAQRVTPVSRADELGFGKLGEADIQDARAI